MQNILDNPYVIGTLTMFIFLYATTIRPDLPPYIRVLFRNPIFRVFILFLIVVRGNKNPLFALSIAIAFVTTLTYLGQQQAKEAFASLNNVKENTPEQFTSDNNEIENSPSDNNEIENSPSDDSENTPEPFMSDDNEIENSPSDDSENTPEPFMSDDNEIENSQSDDSENMHSYENEQSDDTEN